MVKVDSIIKLYKNFIFHKKKIKMKDKKSHAYMYFVQYQAVLPRSSNFRNAVVIVLKTVNSAIQKQGSAKNVMKGTKAWRVNLVSKTRYL